MGVEYAYVTCVAAGLSLSLLALALGPGLRFFVIFLSRRGRLAFLSFAVLALCSGLLNFLR